MRKFTLLLLAIAGIVIAASAQVAESGKITVYFQNSQNWQGDLYIYFHKNNTQVGVEWPGARAETTTIDGQTWYYRTISTSESTGFNAIFNNGNGDGKVQTSDWTNINYDVYATVNSDKSLSRYNTYFLYNTDTKLSTRLDNGGGSEYTATIDNQTSPSDMYFVVANIDAFDYSSEIKGEKWNSASVIRPNGAQNGTQVGFETTNDIQGWSNNATGSWKLSSSIPAYFTFTFKADNYYNWNAYFTRTIEDDYATFSSDYAVAIPEGLNAYYVASVAEGQVNMTKFANGIAANTGAFLQKKGEKTTFKFVPSTSTDSAEGNLLKPTTGEDIAVGNYVFASGNAGLGFYKLTTLLSGVAKGKAYLDGTSISPSRLSISFDNEATGINEAVNVQNTSVAYDLQGRRVAQPTKGLYIINGKKQLFK